MMKRVSAFLLIILLLFCSACAASKTPPKDGQYTVAVTLTGGSGRASVDSPARLTVSGGMATARIVWSSPFYESMTVDGEKYQPMQTEGNAAFEIPVALDADIPVSAVTVAMSEPHTVEYTLHFDSATLAAK